MRERTVVVTAPGRVGITETDAPPVPDRGFRARTLVSGVSAVTVRHLSK